MRLFEMLKLPDKAGLAVLKFDKADGPSRKNEVITIPKNLGSIEFFPLKDGEQFLLRSVDALYFGGTDERPFLVRLDGKAFSFFAEQGEAGFFEALKPPAVHSCEKKWGKDGTKRQGDIFAYELPYSDWWRFVEQYCDGLHTIKLELVEEQLFGTRHTFKGRKGVVAKYGNRYSGDLSLRQVMQVVVGTIEAPDHQTLELKAIHLIDQACYLYRPEEAD